MAQPRDLFKEHGIVFKSPQQATEEPRDLFKEHGIKFNSGNPVLPPFMQLPENRYPALQKSMRQAGGEAQPGAAQGFLNSIIGMANLPSNAINYMAGTHGRGEIPSLNVAPNTPVAQQAGMGGTMASYFGPRGMVKGAMALNPRNMASFAKYMESRPIQDFLLKNLGASTEAGLFSAAHAPEGHKLGAGTSGATTGSAIDILGRLTGIPYIGQAARTGLGYLAGSQFGHPYYGAMIGGTAPNLLKSVFPASKNAIMEEMIGGLNPRDVSRVVKAGEREGIRVRPSEASGNPIQALVEAQPRKTIMGAQEHIKQEIGREHEQQNAIRNFLNSIYTPTAVNEANINALYTKAYQGNLSMNTVNALKQDPIMMDAFNSVKRNPAFTDVPENNYQFLHQVDRTLGRQYRGKVKTDENTAYEINQTKKNFNKLLKKENADYEAAQTTSAPKYQREEIEYKINEDINNEKVTGRDFYNKVLKNYNGYKELVRSLKNNPQARQSLQNMRVIFKNMTKLPSVGTTAEASAKGYTSPRDFMNTLVSKMRDIAGAKTDVAKIKYINNGVWQKDFDKLQEIKDARKYNKELLNLVGRVGVAYGLTPDSAENFKKAISE